MHNEYTLGLERVNPGPSDCPEAATDDLRKQRGGWPKEKDQEAMAVSEVTQILSRFEPGDPATAEQLLPLVYDELRKLAAVRLAQEKPGQTLQATALVHEAYLRLVGSDQAIQNWDNRGHFFAAAAEAMRRILVERARQKLGPRAGGGRRRGTLGDVPLPSLEYPERLLEIDDALDRLAAENRVIAELVKLRIFAGLSVDEAAAALGISRTTGFRHWTYARAWLRAEFARDE